MGRWQRLEDRVRHSDAGTLDLSNPGPGVFLSKAQGRLGLEAAMDYTAFADAVALQHEQAIGLHDWWAMTGYEPGVRQHVVGWSLRVISQWSQIHVALRSQVVNMGVTLANMALGGKVETYPDRDKFDAACRAVLQERVHP